MRPALSRRPVRRLILDCEEGEERYLRKVRLRLSDEEARQVDLHFGRESDPGGQARPTDTPRETSGDAPRDAPRGPKDRPGRGGEV